MARKLNFDPPAEAPPEQIPSQSSTSKTVRPLLGLERPLKPAGAIGAISQTLDGMTERARRADELEKRLVEGQVIVELDPTIIDASIVQDRLEADPGEEAAFSELIRVYGQRSPILVRPHPEAPGRYQVAFGHRRLKATRTLGIKVRAVVRELSDEEMVIAQGQENNDRADLTFIERARYAATLERRGFSRETIMASLSVDKAALSRLIAIATRVPAELIEAIGPARSFGRTRWQAFTELLEKDDGRRRALAVVAEAGFHDHKSDKRFELVLERLRTKETRARAQTWSAADGTHAAKVSRSGKRISLTFDDRVAPQFGDFVQEKLQQLYDEYKASGRGT